MKNTTKRVLSVSMSVFSVIGIVATGVLSARAALKVSKEVGEFSYRDRPGREELIERAKTVVPYYAPPVIVGGVTIACVVGSGIFNTRQQVSMMGAYTALDQSFKKYKGKLIEMYGKETHEAIVDAIAAENTDITSSYICSTVNLLPGNKGEDRLFYDEFSERFFKAPLTQVLNAEYHLNRNYILMGCENINNFYEMLGIPEIEGGNDIGWEQLDEGMYWIEFNHREQKLKDGTPYTVIEMLFEPFCYGNNDIPSWNQYRDYRAFLADEYEYSQRKHELL